MFNRYVFAFEATSALLITAAVGAMVLAHRERLTKKVTQGDLAGERMKRYAATGEHPRIDVVLATGISAERCAAHALGHLDPRAVDPELWARDPDTLVVPHAGELLHRLG